MRTSQSHFIRFGCPLQSVAGINQQLSNRSSCAVGGIGTTVAVFPETMRLLASFDLAVESRERSDGVDLWPR
jgi:hypothetical protein